MAEKEYALRDSSGSNEDYVAIPADLLLSAEVVKVEEQDSFFKDEKTGLPERQISFRFKITDGEFAGRNIFGRTPTTFTNHPDCKFRGWVQEILGVDELPTGFKFTLDVLVGMPVRVLTGNRPGKKNMDGSDGPIKDFVVEVARVKNPAATYASDSF